MRSKMLARITRISRKNLCAVERYEYFCRFTAQDDFNYKCLTADFCKLKDVKINLNYHTLTIDVYDIEDYRRLNDLQWRKDELIDIFYDGLRVGLTGDVAKEAVEDLYMHIQNIRTHITKYINRRIIKNEICKTA